MLGETGRQVMGPICGSGDFLAYGSPSISALPPRVEMPQIDDLIAAHGARENTNGGIFIPGAPYGFEKKLKIASAYLRDLEQNSPATTASISQKCKVD